VLADRHHIVELYFPFVNSVTKVMTLLLVMEAVDAGKIKLDDMVPVSEHAASMGDPSSSTALLQSGGAVNSAACAGAASAAAKQSRSKTAIRFLTIAYSNPPRYGDFSMVQVY